MSDFLYQCRNNNESRQSGFEYATSHVTEFADVGKMFHSILQNLDQVQMSQNLKLLAYVKLTAISEIVPGENETVSANFVIPRFGDSTRNFELSEADLIILEPVLTSINFKVGTARVTRRAFHSYLLSNFVAFCQIEKTVSYNYRKCTIH